jgi:hypothetical protein
MGGSSPVPLVVGLAAAAALAAGSAFASSGEPATTTTPAPPANLSGVTVTAPGKPDPLVDRTTQFVRQRLPTSRNEQYARFRDPVCVKVIGLPEEFDAFVAKRIVEIARQVHAPVAATTKCAPNVNVIFSPQPQAQLTDIAKRRDILFGFVVPADAKTVSAFSRPVQSWYLTRRVGTQGDSELELDNGPECISSHSPNQPLCDIKGPVLGRAGSRLGNDMSSELVHSLVIADAGKVAGQKIDAVADYVAVLALSQWRGLDRCASQRTILNLMAEGCEAEDRPEAATPEDLALLQGLYTADARESGSQQRATIASTIRKAAAADGPRH